MTICVCKGMQMENTTTTMHVLRGFLVHPQSQSEETKPHHIILIQLSLFPSRAKQELKVGWQIKINAGKQTKQENINNGKIVEIEPTDTGCYYRTSLFASMSTLCG
ncbi:hypothetical protein AMECASPLE_032126 [Ameca splendens]|uniref:Uncharacterized protein n=1 Tax=Ameca splendens TaxID=208324 RepID=A0ABV0XVH4_9TELE